MELKTQSSRPRPKTKKIQGQGQGPTSREQILSKTDPLKGKDRNARGQDQGRKTLDAASVLQKKGSQKFFSGDLQFREFSAIFQCKVKRRSWP